MSGSLVRLIASTAMAPVSPMSMPAARQRNIRIALFTFVPETLSCLLNLLTVIGVEIGGNVLSTVVPVNPESVAGFIITKTEPGFYVLRRFGKIFHVIFEKLATL